MHEIALEFQPIHDPGALYCRYWALDNNNNKLQLIANVYKKNISLDIWEKESVEIDDIINKNKLINIVINNNGNVFAVATNDFGVRIFNYSSKWINTDIFNSENTGKFVAIVLFDLVSVLHLFSQFQMYH